MAQWDAPFHLPKYTTEEFEAQKAKYVAQHGYTITIPGLSDIIHFPPPAPMTEREEYEWSKRHWDYFSPQRLADLKKVKAKKRERFLAILSSPVPEILQNAGSIMTSLDDAQDAIATLAYVGRLAAHFAPRVLGKAFLGPAGWLLTASDIMNVILESGQLLLLPMVSKRTADRVTKLNPFSEKSKVARAKKLLDARLSVGDALQALQTTDQVFGVGISLGPIVGLAQGIATGAIRSTLGQKVQIKLPWKAPEDFLNKAFRNISSASNFLTWLWSTDETMFHDILMATYFSHQAILPWQQDWNPLDQVVDLHKVESLPPIPRNILTRQIIEEEGYRIEDVVGWPHTDNLWANLYEYHEYCSPVATKNLIHFVKRNQHNWYGYVGGLLASETAKHALANLEGEEHVRYDYDGKSKICSNLLRAGYYPDPSQPESSLNRFVEYLEDATEGFTSTASKDVIRFCRSNSIKLLPITGSV